MKGGQPKPAAIRALHGSRKRPRHHDEPVIPDEGDPPAPAAAGILPPSELTKAERVHWSAFAPLLIGAKVLTPADVETLADYCRACAAVEDRGRRLRGALRRTPADPHIVRSWDMQVRQWIDRKTKLAGELGLTAISRTRVAWSGHAQIVPVSPTRPPSKLAQLQQEAAALRRPLAVDHAKGPRR